VALPSPTAEESATLRYPALSILALASIVALLYFGRLFFITLATAILLTFILEPFVRALTSLRFPRPLASFVVCLVGLLLLYFVSLGVATQLTGLAEDLPAYTERANRVLDSAFERVNSIESGIVRMAPNRSPMPAGQVQPLTPDAARKRRLVSPVPPLPAPTVQEVRIQRDNSPISTFIYANFGTIVEIGLMVGFIPFLVYFMLSWSDHFHRAILALFPQQNRSVVNSSLMGIRYVARAYVAGNFILGLLLSVASVLLFIYLRLPYPLLIGPLSGFLSLVPYIGLPLALLPPVLAGFAVYSGLTPYLFIGVGVAALHLLALNLLYPKIVGARVHLNPLAVTVALMFWGVMWGGIGLVLAIPITAALKAICDNVQSWQPYGRFLGD
jgi:predicted PurR-regulated permease PerM